MLRIFLFCHKLYWRITTCGRTKVVVVTPGVYEVQGQCVGATKSFDIVNDILAYFDWLCHFQCPPKLFHCDIKRTKISLEMPPYLTLFTPQLFA